MTVDRKPRPRPPTSTRPLYDSPSRARSSRARRSHVRHGHRQRHPRLVFRRRLALRCEAAIELVQSHGSGGADIVDIGAESTRPAAESDRRGRRVATAASRAQGAGGRLGFRSRSIPIAPRPHDERSTRVSPSSTTSVGWDMIPAWAHRCRTRRRTGADAHAGPVARHVPARRAMAT